MRIDKYLKVSRLIKRRSVANDACDAGRVKINGKIIKASAEVAVGDIIEIGFGEKLAKAKVLSIMAHAGKDVAGEMYQIIED